MKDVCSLTTQSVNDLQQKARPAGLHSPSRAGGMVGGGDGVGGVVGASVGFTARI